MAWAADGKGFWYTRHPGTDAPADEQHFNMQVYFHNIGRDAAKDPLVPEFDVTIVSKGGSDLAFSKDRLFVCDIVGSPNMAIRPIIMLSPKPPIRRC